MAHPRSRGENVSALPPATALRGSSPLTRGKPASLVPALRSHRLIPAHAGKTDVIVPLIVQVRAHPRSRGENTRTVIGPPPRRGSSPLTRGKPELLEHRVAAAGLIPAHAGKTCSASPQHQTTWAHPRSRGENGQDGHDEGAPAGSSPLTRGKHCVQCRAGVCDGLIPAHAGKTRGRSSPRRSIRAHPRSRGEN